MELTEELKSSKRFAGIGQKDTPNFTEQMRAKKKECTKGIPDYSKYKRKSKTESVPEKTDKKTPKNWRTTTGLDLSDPKRAMRKLHNRGFTISEIMDITKETKSNVEYYVYRHKEQDPNRKQRTLSKTTLDIIQLIQQGKKTAEIKKITGKDRQSIYRIKTLYIDRKKADNKEK